MEYDDTIGLARRTRVYGANPNQSAIDSEPTTVLLFENSIEGPPILWADIKGMLHLFKEQTSTITKNSLSMAMCVASLHHHKVLRSLLTHRKNSPGLFLGIDPFNSKQDCIQALLGAALKIHTYSLSRCLVHGSRFHMAQSNTINLLMARGAEALIMLCFSFEDFAEKVQGHTAITLPIASDDYRSLVSLLTRRTHQTENVAYFKVMSSKLLQFFQEYSWKCLKLIITIHP
jgi:hypothetical protein